MYVCDPAENFPLTAELSTRTTNSETELSLNESVYVANITSLSKRTIQRHLRVAQDNSANSAIDSNPAARSVVRKNDLELQPITASLPITTRSRCSSPLGESPTACLANPACAERLVPFPAQCSRISLSLARRKSPPAVIRARESARTLPRAASERDSASTMHRHAKLEFRRDAGHQPLVRVAHLSLSPSSCTTSSYLRGFSSGWLLTNRRRLTSQPDGPPRTKNVCTRDGWREKHTCHDESAIYRRVSGQEQLGLIFRRRVTTT